MNFYLAIDLFIKNVLDNQKPRDLQYIIYMAPRGDHVIKKRPSNPALSASHQFKEILRIAELLPASEIMKPMELLVAE